MSSSRIQKISLARLERLAYSASIVESVMQDIVFKTCVLRYRVSLAKTEPLPTFNLVRDSDERYCDGIKRRNY